MRALFSAALLGVICGACGDPANPGSAADSVVVTRQFFPPLPSRRSSASTSVNDNGILVGRSWSDPTVWDRGTRWATGVAPVDVGAPGDSIVGPSTIAEAINDSGRIAGYVSIASDSNYAVQWEPSGKLDTLGPGIAYALNSAGQSVGCYQSPPLRHWMAVVWSQRRSLDLGTLGGDFSCAYAINDSGWVVGSAKTAAGAEHAFLWKSTTGMIDLGSIYNISRAQGLNNRGEVVGVTGDNSVGSPERPFYWTSAGGMVELRTISLTSDGRGRGIAYAINDNGQIAGYCTINTPPFPGLESAVLWRSHAESPLNLTARVGRPLGLKFEDITIARALAISRSGLIAGFESSFDPLTQVTGLPKAAVWSVEIRQ